MHKWSFNSLIIQVLNPSCVTSFMNGPSPTIILLKIQLPVFCNFMQNFTPVNLLSSYNWLMVVSIPHRLNDSSLKSDVGIRLLDYSGAQIVKSCVFARCSVFKPWSEYQFKKWTFQMDTIWPYFWTPINLESEYRTSESREIRSELCLNNHDTFGWVRIYSQIKKNIHQSWSNQQLCRLLRHQLPLTLQPVHIWKQNISQLSLLLLYI